MPLLDNDVVQVSDDGSVVTFNIEDPFSGFRVLRWTLDGPLVLLSDGMLIGSSASGQQVLVAGAPAQPAHLVHFDRERQKVTPIDMYDVHGHGSLSADGNIVFGALYDDSGAAQLARADVATGAIEPLGALGSNIVRAYVNPAGTAVVGSFSPDASSLSSGAYRWNSSGGLALDLPSVDPALQPWPEAVSADGLVLAGRATGVHFRWSQADGYTEVASASWRSATHVSAAGDVVVGSLDPDGANDSAAFRWTAATGAVDLTPGTQSLATAMSADGGVVVATSWEEAQFEGVPPEATFIWDAVNGTRTLVQLLEDRDVDTTGWEFGHARDISSNGKVLVGRATCGGVPTLYRIVLSD